MKEASVYKTIPLEGSEGGTLNFAIIEEPYGEGSKEVVSICAALGGDKGSWKVHIPLTQIKEVRQALKEAKKACKSKKQKVQKTKSPKKIKTKTKDKADKKAKTETSPAKETKTTNKTKKQP